MSVVEKADIEGADTGYDDVGFLAAVESVQEFLKPNPTASGRELLFHTTTLCRWWEDAIQPLEADLEVVPGKRVVESAV